MTHSDIYTKFMIEYDKANITSSYPSLTKYEIATILDKAYLALIAQKYTGNNPRRSAFESDMKAIEDLKPLINNVYIIGNLVGDNSYRFPTDKLNYMYILHGEFTVNNSVNSFDGKAHSIQEMRFVSHEEAKNYKATTNNMPWIEYPTSVIENNSIITYVDPTVVQYNGATSTAQFLYLKQPNKFAVGPGNFESDYDFTSTKFELSDSMAEELINLAIIMSTEIVESSRLTTKVNTRPLES